jgi:hypothetical protein
MSAHQPQTERPKPSASGDPHIGLYVYQCCLVAQAFPDSASLADVRNAIARHACKPSALIAAHYHFCRDCQDSYARSWSNCGGHEELLCRSCAGQDD